MVIYLCLATSYAKLNSFLSIVPRTYPPEKQEGGMILNEGSVEKNVAKVMEILADKGLV